MYRIFLAPGKISGRTSGRAVGHLMGQSLAECGCGFAGTDFLARRVEDLHRCSKHEHKHLCSAARGSCKTCRFGSISPGAFPDVFCPFSPKQTCLGWDIAATSQLGGEHGPCARGCGDRAPARSCSLTSGRFQISNLAKI